MKEAVIEVEDLSIDYALSRGTLRAVDRVSFSVGQGEVLGLVGESGSGKSTVAVALLGLLDSAARIVSGRIRFQGRDTGGFDETAWRSVRGSRIGMIFQSPQDAFSPTATIGRHLTEALRTHFSLSSAEAGTRALAALDLVKMPRSAEVLRSYAFELSGGMCQRAALALALALEPAVLIADEPTSSLDLLAQVEIAQLLDSLRERLGLSMVVISHDIGLIGRLADRVAVMHRGKVVETGPAQSVFSAPRDAYTMRLLSSVTGLERDPVPAMAREREMQ